MLKIIKKYWLLICLIAVLIYLTAGAVAPFIRYQEMDEAAKAEADAAFDVQTALEGRESTDRAMLVETNAAALEERFRLIQMAQERIIISTFDMREGESTDDLLALLLHKADQGVNIKILVDGISGVVRMQPRECFYVLSSHPNVEIKLYNRLNLLTPWKTQGRMHDKYVMADDIGYILGGRNTFDYFLGEYDINNSSLDREVFVYNSLHGKEGNRESSLFVVEEYFNQLWEMEECTYYKEPGRFQRKTDIDQIREEQEKRYEGLVNEYPQLFASKASDYENITKETQGVYLLSNPTGIYGKKPIVFYQMTELMKASGEPAVIHTPYIVCNDYMYQTLAKVCAAVPEVELLINSVENGDNFFAAGDYMKNKEKVFKTGMDIYEYDGGTSYHGKSAVIGQNISVIGSYNFDLRSTYMDTELMLVVHSRGLTAELWGHMEAMKGKSRHVTDADSFEAPEGWSLPHLPAWKRGAMKIVGYIMQPFRCVI